MSLSQEYRINYDELLYTTDPYSYSYEFISARSHGKWRIRDAKDNACGSAENEASAQEAVRVLDAVSR